MGKFSRIEEINVWQDGCRLAIEVYKITRFGKLAKDFGLRDQIRRSAVSIASNIAEGFERQSNKEFIRFLYIAKGSAGELRTQIYIIYQLRYISKDSYIKILDACKLISKKISRLISYLSKQ